MPFGSSPDLRKLLTDPGPTSKISDLLITIEGQARLALIEDPPDPRNCKRKKDT